MTYYQYEFDLLEDKEETCKDCLSFKNHKEKCWYFWEGKKDCSQKITDI